VPHAAHHNQAFDYYITNYPEEGEKVLGFLTYNWIFALDLDHIYTAWYFYITLAWLAASLAACTSTRQWPAVKVRPLCALTSMN
jgi:cytochrome c biogenesis protein